MIISWGQPEADRQAGRQADSQRRLPEIYFELVYGIICIMPPVIGLVLWLIKQVSGINLPMFGKLSKQITKRVAQTNETEIEFEMEK